MRLKDLINLSAELANNSDFAYGGVKESITRELIAEVQRTICKERRWSWLLKTTTFNTVAGQEEYLLPRDLREIYTIIEGNTPNKLIYIGQDDFDVLKPLTTERGIPTHYRLFGRRNDIYNIGTVSINTGSKKLIGKGTDWSMKTNIYPHQRITLNNSKEVYTIITINPIIISHWTLRPAPFGSWRSVTYGNGLFVAVAHGGDNQVMTSPDGITWTLRPAPFGSWRSVTYGNGLFVAVAHGGDNQVMTATIECSIILHETALTTVADSTYSIKIDNQIIRFYPIPEREITITLRYFQEVLDLRDDEDESIIPDDTILAYGTAMLIKAKNEEDATWLSDMYQKMLREMRKQDEERFDHLDQFSPPVRQFQNQWNPFVI